MLIAQISDLHVRPEGTLYQGVVDSNRMLANAIEHLQDLDRLPDLLLVSGDLVDEGLVEEYASLRNLLARSRIPYLVIPGNHDDRENFRSAFRDHTYLPRHGPLHYCIDRYPVRIVALDSTIPGKHYGGIDRDGLEWLRTTLSLETQKPTVIMLHHPPFVSGIPYMDQYRYMDAAPLEEIISGSDNIEIVLCGHVHRSILRRWAGSVLCSCPSTTSEIALQLAADASPKSFLGPPACMLHLWSKDQGMVSHVSYIGAYPGPFPFG